MKDEGEAPVELLESLRLAESLLAESLGQRACGLVAGGAQQVEIFPVELSPVFGRGKDDQTKRANRSLKELLVYPLGRNFRSQLCA